jgi:4-diphosphocytidyl-2-C-methyl-D-erythritol kinase
VIDFGDTLEVSASASALHDTLTCDAPGVPLDSSNLVLRAFDLFRRKTGSKQARAPC